jgi:hypothetical protein
MPQPGPVLKSRNHSLTVLESGKSNIKVLLLATAFLLHHSIAEGERARDRDGKGGREREKERERERESSLL